MKITIKIGGIFFLLILIISSLVYSYYMTSRSGTDQIKNIEIEIEELIQQNHLQQDVQRLVMEINDRLIAGSDKMSRDDINILFSIIENSLELLKNRYLVESDEKSFINDQIKAYKVIKLLSLKLLDINSPHNSPEAGRLMEELDHSNDRFINLGNSIALFVKGEITRSQMKWSQSSSHLELIVSLGSLSSIIITLLGLLYLYITISKPVDAIKKLALEVADGHLENRSTIDSNDEIGELATAFNQMIANLQTSNTGRMQANRFTEGIVESMVDSLLVFDMQGKVLKANNSSCELLGYDKEELLGMESVLIIDDISKINKNGINNLLLNGAVHDHETSFLTKRNRQIPVAISYSVIPYIKSESGEDIAVIVAVARDTRELKLLVAKVSKVNRELVELNGNLEKRVEKRTIALTKSQDELKELAGELQVKNQKIEEAYSKLKSTQSTILQQEKMASIGQLAAGVAHEVNNPTGFIISNLEVLGKYMEKIKLFVNAQSDILFETSLSTEALLKCQQEIKALKKKLKIDYILEDTNDLIVESLDGSQRVKTIVENLKSFSRIDSAEHEPADINECIKSAINIAWNELKYKVTMHEEYGDLPLVQCYPQQINQVILNILVNACHAIDNKGEMSVRSWQAEKCVYFSISDTGSGISQEHINRIFEPFFTTKPVGKGTGLGLSITYDIIKKHNGTIDVKSERGKGTTFTIGLPLAESCSEEVAA